MSMREQALDLTTSFVVRAPAGSGKTELLIQRYLQALLNVADFHTVVVLSFTQKSAAEIRERILGLLQGTWTSPQPKTQALAQSVREKIQAQNSTTPLAERLSLWTLDAYFLTLYQRFCEESDRGQSQLILDLPSFYKREAQKFLIHFTSVTPHPAVMHFISLGYQRFHTLQDRLVQLFSLRDRWLFSEGAPYPDSWDTFFHHELQALLDLLPTETTLPAIIDFLQTYLPKSPIKLSQTQQWSLIAQALLTERQEWRKSFRSAQGVPTVKDLLPWHTAQDRQMVLEEFARLQDLLKTQPVLTAFLQLVRSFSWDAIDSQPDSHFSDFMRLVWAWATVAKQEQGAIDFQTMTQKVSALFEDPQTQRTIEAYCEEHITHLFLDESQDLSGSQAKIIHAIIQTFAYSEKSVFIVGDPQQAIYYFRGSDLSVFQSFEKLQCPGLSIVQAALIENYRSAENLVHFVNEWMQYTFGPLSSSLFGIDKAMASVACSARAHGDLTLSAYAAVEEEAYGVALDILQEHREHPDRTIAVLARDRTTLRPIAKWLRFLQLVPQSSELENIYDQELYQDILSLFQILIEPTQRSHWLVFLSSRWVRATYKDIENIYAQEIETFWSLTLDELSLQLQQDLQPFLETHKQFSPYKGRQSLVDYSARWLCALGVESMLHGIEKNLYQEILQAFLNHIQTQKTIDWSLLDSWARQTTLKLPQVHQGKIILLTIHKSKGLEFDTVFLPNMAARLPIPDTPQAIFTHQPSGCLRASQFAAKSDLFDKLSALDKYHHEYEAQRLLYVAMTRAKLRLSFSFNDRKCDSRSFYASLEKSGLTEKISYTRKEVTVPMLHRTTDVWKTPLRPLNSFAWEKISWNTTELEWKKMPAGSLSQTTLGKLWHSFLRAQPLGPLEFGYITKTLWQQWWSAQGGEPEDYEQGLRDFGKAIVRLQSCPVMQQIFSITVKTVYTEQEFAYENRDGQMAFMRIDRLIQKSDGSWWLIDWKTSPQAIENRASLLNQLALYQKILKNLHFVPLEVGIYILSTQQYWSWEDLTRATNSE